MNRERNRLPASLRSARATSIAMVVLLAAAPYAQAAWPDGQFLRDWLLAGPVSTDAMATAQLVARLPRSGPAPAAGQRLDLPNGERLTWTRYTAPGSIVNLIHALGQHERVSGLACTTIHAEQAGTARFHVGSDDQIAILLNRRIVHRVDQGRPLSPDQEIFTAPLCAGENECLVIVGQGRKNWGFTLRVEGGPESPEVRPPPPLIWDAVDVLEQDRELYSPHWRYRVGDDADFARADYDDASWEPLSPDGQVVGLQNAAVVWFRVPIWVRPSLVGLPCSLKSRPFGRWEVYLDGVQVATLAGAAEEDVYFTPSVPFAFSAPHQQLAVRLERSDQRTGADTLPFQLALAAMTQAGAEYDAGVFSRQAPVRAELERLRQEVARTATGSLLRVHRLIIMATLILFLVFHVALLYYYPRRLANRCFCVTLSLTLTAMLVLHAQEAADGDARSRVLYWVFLGLVPSCLLSGLALVHALWCDRVPRGQLLAWAALAAVLYLAGLVRSERLLAFAIVPLATAEYLRIYVTRALGQGGGAGLYGVGLACFVAAQTVSVLAHLTSLLPAAVDVPYAWVYGFVALLACVSVDIGREFAGAVRKLEELTATLDSRVQQVTQQLEAKVLAQASLETLRYQLNPHFLYNALNSVEALSREEPTQIPELVRRLCECLRYALHPKKGGLATLQQELNEVTSYLRVEHVRFGEQLAVDTDVSEDALQRVVPEFLLQPLVENAIKYGMRTSAMPLRVTISAGCTNGRLQVEVRNTGRWSTEASDVHSHGVGLQNLRKRLDLLYADRYRLELREDAGRVSVTVEIPLEA